MLSVGTGSPSGIKMLDLFSGIGGFHLGLERAGYKIGWSGFCEIDKYASAVYKRRFPDAQELGDIRAIQPERDLPDHIDVLCGGFPCQSFSIAGKRRSFEDTRGTLFFEIARILKYYRDVGRPISYFILENVKGLYSAGDHSVLPTIYGILTDLDYTVESQLLNTRWVLPQNRERIYIVGHLRKRGGSKIFPIGEDGETHIRSQARAKSKAELCSSITTREGGRKENNFVIVDKTFNPKLNQKVADYRTDEGIRIRESGDAPCLTASHHSESEPSRMQGLVITKQTSKPVEMIVGLQKNAAKMQDCSPSLTSAMGEGGGHIPILNQSSIRRLTPKECERLQGFADGWTEGQSDTQRYKQLGNAVSVPVVKAVGDKIFKCL